MKICPVCKMTVNADSECPICHSTITYEPDVDSEKEKYVFNKHLVIYLLNKCFFSAICLLFSVITLFFINSKFHLIFLLPTIFAVISFLFSLFDRRLINYIQWKYSKEYSEVVVDWERYGSGVLSIVISIMFLFLLK